MKHEIDLVKNLIILNPEGQTLFDLIRTLSSSMNYNVNFPEKSKVTISLKVEEEE